MAGYLIAQVQVNDPELYRKYQQAVLPTIQKHGGKVLAAAPEAEIVEGSWPTGFTVILQFESVEAARGWYESDDYAEPLAIRHKAASANLVFVQGI